MSQPLGAHAFAGACGAKTLASFFFFRSLPLQIQSRAAFPSHLVLIQDTEKPKEQGGVVQISFFFFFPHTRRHLTNLTFISFGPTFGVPAPYGVDRREIGRWRMKTGNLEGEVGGAEAALNEPNRVE